MDMMSEPTRDVDGNTFDEKIKKPLHECRERRSRTAEDDCFTNASYNRLPKQRRLQTSYVARDGDERGRSTRARLNAQEPPPSLPSNQATI